MANTVPPPTFQIIGAILVFISALAALGTFAADHAYRQQLMQGSGKPRLPTNWLLIPMGERIVSLRHKQADPRAERLRLRAGRWWRATGVLLVVAFLYFVFVPPMVGG